MQLAGNVVPVLAGLPVSDLLPLTMTDYDQVPVSSMLENNGHAAKLSNTYQ